MNTMSKLVPLSRLLKKAKDRRYLANTSVVLDNAGHPVGFVFGRDAFITFLQHIDDEFEKNVSDPKKAYHNPAGKLIDLIEEHLSLKPDFVANLKSTVSETKPSDWISLKDLKQALHV